MVSTHTSTNDLLGQLSKSSDAKAQGKIVAEIIERYKAPAYSQAVRLCGNDRSLADDAFQDAFIRLFKWLPQNSDRLNEDGVPKILSVFVKRASIDILRKRWRPELKDFDVETLPEENQRPAAGTRLDLEKLLSTLEPRQRLVIELSYLRGMTAPEIGDFLQISQGNVRILRHRAMKSLQARVAVAKEKNSGEV